MSRPSYRMRRYLFDIETKIPPRKADLATVVALLEYEFVEDVTHAPDWQIAFTLRLRDTKIERKVYTPEELKPLVGAKLLIDGPDIPLTIKGAEVALGAFVLKTNYTRTAKDALYRRPSLVLMFSFEGSEPLEHRASRYFRRKRR